MASKEMYMEQPRQIAVRLDTAARLIDIPPTTLRELIKRGVLPARKVGNTWRVRVEDLHALVGATPAT